MAKIQIILEDSPSGMVKVTSNPNYETMLKMVTSGEELTPAHHYAQVAILALRTRSKDIKRMANSGILMPTRIGPA